MRIALLATSYPSSPGDPSGHFVRAEALTFAHQKHEVHVFAPAPHPDPEIHTHPCGGANLFSWPGAIARLRASPSRAVSLAPFVAHTIDELYRVNPEVLYAHWALPCGWPIGSILTQIPLELISHGADVRLLLRLPLSLRIHLVEQLLHRARRWRFVAMDLQKKLSAELPISLAKRLKQHSFIAPPLVSVEERRTHSPPFPFYALTLGRMVPEKRTTLAIQAIAQTESLALVLAGDGPERPMLEEIAERLLPGRHLFLGRISREDALGYLEGALALLHPSAEEAAPTAVLEALALGVPTLTSGAGDTQHWEEKSKLFVLPPEAQRYAEILRRYEINRVDRSPLPWGY